MRNIERRSANRCRPERPRSGQRTAALVLLAVSIASCGKATESDTSTVTSSLGTPASPTSGPALLRERCPSGPANGKAILFSTSDGARLYGAILGGGAVGIVFANDEPHELCEELPEATFLARHGYRVLVFDYRGRGDSEAASADAGRLDLDVEGAVDELVRRGARRVFLFGTYAGGAISVVAATSTPERIAGVIAVSPAAGKGQYVDGPYSASGAFEVAGRLRVPVLYITVRTDEYVPIGEARRLYRLTGSPVKRLEVIPAGGGGWTLFNVSPYAPRANRAVLEFLNRMAR